MKSTANFGISAVRYDSNGTHIEKLMVHKIKELSVLRMGVKIEILVSDGEEWLKTKVLSHMVLEATFVTLVKRQGGYHMGETVHVVGVPGESYLRTDRNNTPEDNLGSLPTF